jgi:hypothetical protein
MDEPGPPVERVRIDALTPHPSNVREGDVGAISESLREFGLYRPIVVQRATPDGDDRMVIVAGTHTWRAAEALGWTEMDAVMLTVDDQTAVRIMLADNRTHDLGRDRGDDLAELLARLGEPAMVGTGWDSDDLDTLLRDLGKYDPGAGILAAFDGVDADSGETVKTFLHGRDAAGNDLFVMRLSLTEGQRDDVLQAFAKAKRNGTPTQPDALALIARHYMEA